MSPVADLIGRIETGLATTSQSGGSTAPNSSGPADSGAVAGDQLAQAIADAVRLFGKQSSTCSLLAGLPLVAGRLPIEHAALAAAGAGLELTEEAGDPLALDDHEFPVIVASDAGAVRLLTGLVRNPDGRVLQVVVQVPGDPQSHFEIPTADFASEGMRRILRVRPKAGGGAGEVQAERVAARPHDWFLDAFRGSRRIYGEAIAATVAVNVLALALPLFTMNVYDRVLPNNAEATLWALAIGALLATVFDFAIKTLRSTFVDAASRRADVLLSNFVYGRLLGARLPERAVPAGIRANTLREFETLREFFNSVTLTTFGDLPFLVLFLLAIAIVAGPLVFVPLAAIPIVAGIAFLSQRSLARAMQAQFQQTAQKNAVVVETLVGFESIKAAGAESWAASRWEQAVAEHIRTGLKIRHVSNFGVHLIHACQTIIQVLMVIAGFYLVAAGQITSGALIAATMLAGRALAPLGAIAMIISRLHMTRIAFESLSEIVNSPQERPEGSRFLDKTEIQGGVAFEHVGFGYDKLAPPALADVSFSIARGEKVAIVGAIGSGKTTLLRLAQGLHLPSSGKVLIDGIAIGQYDPALLRRNVGLLLQGGELFSGTIRSNITLGDAAASDDAVLKAAHAAGALDWIAKLPAGLDTPVRERGSGLSSGQRQSIALARTLLRKPRIVLLDEPTSDMDGRTELLVIRRLREHLKGRTLIVVTHRPAMLDLVDRIIVIEAGRKVADGPKAQVLAALNAVAGRNESAPAKPATTNSPVTMLAVGGGK